VADDLLEHPAHEVGRHPELARHALDGLEDAALALRVLDGRRAALLGPADLGDDAEALGDEAHDVDVDVVEAATQLADLRLLSAHPFHYRERAGGATPRRAPRPAAPPPPAPAAGAARRAAAGGRTPPPGTGGSPGGRARRAAARSPPPRRRPGCRGGRRCR